MCFQVLLGDNYSAVIYKIILLLVNHFFLKQINSTTNDKLETLEGELKTVKALLQEKEGVSQTGTASHSNLSSQGTLS